MPPPSALGDTPAIGDDVRRQAIAWFVESQSGSMSPLRQQVLLQWRQNDPCHEAAWNRLASMEMLSRGAAGVNSALALDVLQQAGRQRRRTLKLLAGAGLTGGLLWQLRDTWLVRQAITDHHAGIGERRDLHLPDGTLVSLNTRSLLNVRYDEHVRRLILAQGEIIVTTASDPQGRPLYVETPAARLRPIGTRFIVRHESDALGTRLSVDAGQVAVARPAGTEEIIVAAGQYTLIDRHGIQPAQAETGSPAAWADGLLIATRMRLGDFVRELARYRPGILRCDPAVADLRLTGSYPLADTDRILAALAQTLPVRVTYRTRYWVTVGALAG